MAPYLLTGVPTLSPTGPLSLSLPLAPIPVSYSLCPDACVFSGRGVDLVRVFGSVLGKGVYLLELASGKFRGSVLNGSA